jgi:hypothetical protein
MKKTVLVLLIVMLLVPMGLFASLFNFSVGATAQYNKPFDVSTATEEDWAQLAEIESYAFGADIRTRLLFVELDVTALYSQEEDGDYYKLSGLITGGVSLDLLGLARVGLGMGPRVYALFDENGEAFIYSDEGEITPNTDFAEAFMNAPMTYRATADFKLGNILLGINYTVDSDGFTFTNMDTAKLAPDFANGRIGASVLFTLF